MALFMTYTPGQGTGYSVLWDRKYMFGWLRRMQCTSLSFFSTLLIYFMFLNKWDNCCHGGMYMPTVGRKTLTHLVNSLWHCAITLDHQNNHCTITPANHIYFILKYEMCNTFHSILYNYTGCIFCTCYVILLPFNIYPCTSCTLHFFALYVVFTIHSSCIQPEWLVYTFLDFLDRCAVVL